LRGMERGGWEGEEIYRPRVFRNSTSDELTHCVSGRLLRHNHGTISLSLSLCVCVCVFVSGYLFVHFFVPPSLFLSLWILQLRSAIEGVPVAMYAQAGGRVEENTLDFRASSLHLGGWMGERLGDYLSRGLELGQGDRLIPRRHLCPAHSIVPMALMGRAMVMLPPQMGERKEGEKIRESNLAAELRLAG
jgi:hypothetical protein